jgi:hypothetical protein
LAIFLWIPALCEVRDVHRVAAVSKKKLSRRDGLKKKLPRRCRDGIQKNVLISEPVTGLN